MAKKEEVKAEAKEVKASAPAAPAAPKVKVSNEEWFAALPKGKDGKACVKVGGEDFLVSEVEGLKVVLVRKDYK